MKVESVLISDIIVRDRCREDYGDLDGLAASIAKYGLIEPIVVDETDGEIFLVAGERRLKACKEKLQWQEIDARFYSDLTPQERLEIELEENLQRKELTPHEASRRLVQSAENTATLISAIVTEKKSGETRGRKSDYKAPKEDVARALGVSGGTLRNAEKHVEAVAKYPELALAGSQKEALAAAAKLDQMPEREREKTRRQIASNDRQTISNLTGKSQKSKPKSESAKWRERVAGMSAFFSEVQVAGGAEGLTGAWTEKERADFINELNALSDQALSLLADLEEMQIELKRRAG